MDMNLNGMHTSGSDARPHPVNGSRPGSGPAAHAPGRPRTAADTGLTEAFLADRGRASALEALGRDGYVGPAPVPLAQYARTVANQSLSAHTVDLDTLRTGFADTVIQPKLLANNGMLVINDLGRQRLEPQQLLKRWIVPLEEADYLTIWQQECRHHGIDYDPALARFVLDELHARHGVPLLPCHPRDLIDMSVDYGRYMNQETLSADALRRAWETYFVGLDEPGGMAS